MSGTVQGRARIGDDTVGTKLVAADHDADVRLPGRRSHLRVTQRIVTRERARDFLTVPLFAAERDSQLTLACAADLLNQLRNVCELTGAHDQIDMRSPLKHPLLLLLGHAADHAEDLGRVLIFRPLEPSDRAVRLLFCQLPHAARVEQDRVRLLGVVGEFISLLPQCCDNEFAVQHVHLTADGFDIQFAVVVHYSPRRHRDTEE